MEQRLIGSSTSATSNSIKIVSGFNNSSHISVVSGFRSFIIIVSSESISGWNHEIKRFVASPLESHLVEAAFKSFNFFNTSAICAWPYTADFTENTSWASLPKLQKYQQLLVLHIGQEDGQTLGPVYVCSSSCIWYVVWSGRSVIVFQIFPHSWCWYHPHH